MNEWFVANAGSIIVGAIVFIVITAAVTSIIKKKKSGKSTCGCDCGNCSGSCH